MTIFCDLDGTLIDSTKRHIVLLQDLLQHHRINLNIDSYLSFKCDGNSTKSFLVKSMISCPLAEQITAEWKEHIEDEKYLTMDTVYPDALPFLRKISKEYDVVYVSARKNKEAIINALEYLDLVRFAKRTYIVDPANAVQGKTKAIEHMVTRRDYFIGDTETDWECARRLGITGLVLNRGFRSKAYWDAHGVTSFADLEALQVKIIDKRKLVNNGTI